MKTRALRNRTLTCSEDEMQHLSERLVSLGGPVTAFEIENTIIHQDTFSALPQLPAAFVDLMILDPPYNISKNYDGHIFNQKHSSSLSRLVCFTNRRDKTSAQTYRVGLRVLRLEDFDVDSSHSAKCFSRTESNYLGERKGTWCFGKLEK